MSRDASAEEHTKKPASIELVRRFSGLLFGLLSCLSVSAQAVIWPSTVERVAKELAAHDVAVRR